MEMWTADQMKSIDKMLNPRSIAVVGASPKGGYGGRLLSAVLKAKDRIRIYPVNPNYDEIMGVKSYKSVADLPEAPDLVGVVVPYGKVLEVWQDPFVRPQRQFLEAPHQPHVAPELAEDHRYQC